MSLQGVSRLYRRHYSSGFALLSAATGDRVEAGSNGTRVEDCEGQEYLDFAGGFGVFTIGHANDSVRKKVERQLSQIALEPPFGLSSQAVLAFGEELEVLLPGDLRLVFVGGSGSEAVEVALLAASLLSPERRSVVSSVDGYHGNTLGALNIAGSSYFRRRLRLQFVLAESIQFGYADGLDVIRTKRPAAVFIEPVQGTSLRVPPTGYLQEIRSACDEAGALMAVDEVQTGFGRTGRMFGVDHEGVVPDIMVLSKALTGGIVPVSAVAMRQALGEQLDELGVFQRIAATSRGGGSSLGCAAATATLQYIREHRLVDRSAELGETLGAAFEGVARDFPRLVLECVGLGLMRGMVMRNAAVHYLVWLGMFERGVLVGPCPDPTIKYPVLRFLPPLTVSLSELALCVDALKETLRAVARVPLKLIDLASMASPLQERVPVSLIAALSWLRRRRSSLA